MSITCQICQTIFPNIIPWQHLKKHGVTSAEYKINYGPLYGEETIRKIAERVPHNKGKKVTDPTSLENIRLATAKREERFRNGEIRRGQKWDDEHKQLLSRKTKEYAAANPEKMSARGLKSIETRKTNGYDLAFFRGCSHSAESKEKMAKGLARANAKKTQKRNERISSLITQYNLTLLSTLDRDPLELKCNTCKYEFTFTAQYFNPTRTFSEMCPQCYPRVTRKSKGETELYEYVQRICPDAIQGYREKYHSSEIDIFIPSKNIGFEFDGLYWHSEEVLGSIGQRRTKSDEKRKWFAEKGVRLITIFSDEWEQKQKIVKSRTAAILGATTKRIYARQCQIIELSSAQASSFCDDHHIMGKGRSNVRVGLCHNGALVSVMTFSKSNLSRKIRGWELNRFASITDTTVVGGASKMFKYFIEHYAPESIISYSDNRWSLGNLYSRLGFEKVSDGTPNYWYFKLPNGERIHRFTLRKNKTDDQTLTEYENRVQQGYSRIWDCGSAKWVWRTPLPLETS